MSLLNGRLELHAPQCAGSRCTCDRIDDLEAFARSVAQAHLRAGSKRPDGDLTGPATIRPTDFDDLVSFLISEGYTAAKRFDGRGRLNGWVLSVLHFRVTDWARGTYGSTRYGPLPQLVPFDPALHDTASYLDPEYDGGDVLDLDAAPAGTRQALKLLQPLIEGEVETAKQVAELAQVEPKEVESALALVRVAARRQGLEPDDEERHALADQARDLREQRMSYRQIATTFSLPSSSTVATLIRDYHPELIKRNTRRAPIERKPTPVIVNAPMKSRDGQRHACVYCNTPTLFLRAIVGSNSTHPEWEDCCADCGERPARRVQLAHRTRPTYSRESLYATV